MRKDTRYEWRREKVPRLTGLSVPWFAVDDSEVLVRGSRHTILAALSFWEPATVLDRIARLRAHLGFAPEFEFKWNSKLIDAQTRDAISEEFRQILSTSFGLLTIMEGTDRQRAAEMLVLQIADFVDGPVVPFVVFDENTITDEVAFRQFLVNTGRDVLGRLQFSVARSCTHDLLQCADLFVGFQNYKIRIALGDARDRIVQDEYGNLLMSAHLEMSLRNVLWGQVVTKIDQSWTSLDCPPPDWLFKETQGLGMRIHSSINSETQALIYDEVGRPYFGCLH